MKQKHPLVGRPVTFQGTARYAGMRAGIVRGVTMTRGTKGTKKKQGRPAVLKTILVQRPGGDAQTSGSSYSARCDGDRHRVGPDQVLGVSWHGKIRPLAEFLESRLRTKAAKVEG